MEGRDIGTKVFPQADVKIFLDADPSVRGARRFHQHQGGNLHDREAVIAEMRERDYRDRSRASSPLQPAPDAVIIDSTDLDLDQVIERVEQVIRSLKR
jgi:CMP/dCMP kinase